jgi:hypothetical protein
VFIDIAETASVQSLYGMAMQRKVRTSQGRVPVENFVQARGRRRKPLVTESATESEPLRPAPE